MTLCVKIFGSIDNDIKVLGQSDLECLSPKVDQAESNVLCKHLAGTNTIAYFGPFICEKEKKYEVFCTYNETKWSRVFVPGKS